MDVYVLPDDLLTNRTPDPDEVLIRCYAAEEDSVRNKIVLNQNMINVLVGGTKTIVYPESTAEVKGGELVVLSAGNVLTSELLTGGQNFRSVLFYFSNEVFNRFLIKYRHLLKYDISFSEKPSFLIFKQDERIKQFASSMQALLSAANDLPPELRLLKIEELLLYILHAHPERFNAIRAVTSHKDELQLKRVVESHIGMPITVNELAFLCHMSTSTFKRRFGEMYQTTPQQWLLVKRMERAAELLRSRNESPSSVYLKAGYQNHSSFTEAFKNRFGCTPSEYQQGHLNVLP